jgi:putative Mn2+ efflux pump MntP
MVWESLHPKDERSKIIDISKGFALLTLAVATSIDAFAIGLTLAFLKVHIAVASITIGTIAFVATVIGFVLGRKVSKLMGRWAETIGGVVLIGIGLRILLSHILS